MGIWKSIKKRFNCNQYCILKAYKKHILLMLYQFGIAPRAGPGVKRIGPQQRAPVGGMGYPSHLITENPTANHSGATCLERCHVSLTLNNPSVFSMGEETIGLRHKRLNCPILPSSPYFSGNKNLSTPLSLCPISF